MRVLLVFCHPLDDSYGAALVRRARAALEGAGHEVEFIELYREGFDPVLSPAERAAYHSGAYDSSAVARHVERLRRAESLVFVFPHWWFNLPAMLKGWFDRVWAPGVAFEHDPAGGRIVPLLGHVREFRVITTFGSPWWIVNLYMRNPTRRIMKGAFAALCAPGCRFRWLALHDLDRSTQAKRERFLGRVARELGALRG